VICNLNVVYRNECVTETSRFESITMWPQGGRARRTSTPASAAGPPPPPLNSVDSYPTRTRTAPPRPRPPPPLRRWCGARGVPSRRAAAAAALRATLLVAEARRRCGESSKCCGFRHCHNHILVAEARRRCGEGSKCGGLRHIMIVLRGACARGTRDHPDDRPPQPDSVTRTRPLRPAVRRTVTVTP
jgi:hypothetical protein